MSASNVATLVARAQLAGWTLRRLPDGAFAAERWGRLVFLSDLQAAQQWLGRVTGKKAAA